MPNNMRHYFQLQYTMLNRHLRAFGLHPALAYLLGLLVFAGLSVYLFGKTAFAVYIYLLVALSVVFNLSEGQRNEFLKNCFSRGRYWQTRLLENILCALPFLLFLSYKACYLPAGGLFLAAGALALFRFETPTHFALPTPFYKRPFEFIVGFRQSFYLFFVAYFLALMAVLVDNFNLGMFALLLVFLICLSFYGNPENRFYVWVYALGPEAFLWHKIKTAVWCASVLASPITLGLIVFFPQYSAIVLGVQCLGYVYLSLIILAKYTAFPHTINVPQAFFIAFGLWLPPLLLGIIPFFYMKSKQNLREVLN